MHQLDAGSERVVEQGRIENRRRAIRRKNCFPLLEIGDRFHRHAMPHIADLHVGRDAADPAELSCVVANALGADQLLLADVLNAKGDGGTVLRRRVGHEVGGDDALRAPHVGDDHGRASSEMAADMAGQEARVKVIAAAGRPTHIEGHRLALEEVRLRRRGRGGADEGHRQRKAVKQSQFVCHRSAALPYASTQIRAQCFARGDADPNSPDRLVYKNTRRAMSRCNKRLSCPASSDETPSRS